MARGPWGAASSGGLGDRISSAGRRLDGRLGSVGDRGLRIEIDGAQGDFALAMQGKLQASIDAQMRALEDAYWRAMNQVVETGKGRLRADIVAGGFHKGQALSKTWRGSTYPRSKDSLEVAGWLTTKIGLLIDVFDTGTVIRVAGNQQFLAIPLGPAKAIVRRLHRQRMRGLTGRNAWGRFEKAGGYTEQVAQMLGVDLQPIIAPDRQSGVLVAANELTLTSTGKAAKNQARAATPLFALVKIATLKKRIQGRALLQEIERGFPADFARALAGALPPENRSDA